MLLRNQDYKLQNARYEFQAGWTRPLRQMLRSILPQRPLSVLDVGCGTGAVFRDMYKTGWEFDHFCAIDRDINALCYLTGTVDAAAYCGFAEELPFETESFDFVFCHYLLLWSKDPVTILQEMKRVCKRDGICAAMAEPDYASEEVESACIRELASGQLHALIERGIDPFAGSSLKQWFTKALFSNVQSATYDLQKDGGKGKEFLTREIEQMQQDQGIEPVHYEITPDMKYIVPTWFAWARV